MPGRPLAPDEIEKVLYEVRKEESSSHALKWPDFDNRVLLAQAVKNKLPYVTLNGMRFSIRYVTHFGGAVFIRPADTTSFVPCGYFTVKKLMELLG
jgi:hypothetical protein